MSLLSAERAEEYAKQLGLKVKSYSKYSPYSELTSGEARENAKVNPQTGGKVYSEILDAISSFREKALEAGLPDVIITGGNDYYHKGLSYVSNHTKGTGIDLVFTQSMTRENLKRAEEIVFDVISTGKYDNALPNHRMGFIDEYIRKTSAGTGNHFHFSLTPNTSNECILPLIGINSFKEFDEEKAKKENSGDTSSGLSNQDYNKREIQETLRTQFSNSNDIDEFFKQFASNGFVDWFNKNHSQKGFFTSFVNDNGRKESAKGPIESNSNWKKVWNNISIIFNKNSINLAEFLSLNTIIINISSSFEAEAERVGSSGHNGIAYSFNKIDGTKKSYNTLDGNKTAFELFNNADYINTHGNLRFADKYKNTSDTAWQGENFPPGGTSEEAGNYPNGGDKTFLTEADFHKFRGRGFVQTTGRKNYLPLIKRILNYSGTNNTINTIKQDWKQKGGTNLDKIATISTNEQWNTLFKNTDGIISSFAIWEHTKENDNYIYIDVEQSENSIRRQVRDVAFNIAGRGANGYADTFEKRFYQQLNELLGREPDDVPTEEDDQEQEEQEPQGDPTSDNGRDAEDSGYPGDLPKVKGLTNFFRPTIEVDPVEFDVTTNPQSQKEITNTLGYQPLVWYETMQIRYIKSFKLSSKLILPTFSITFQDQFNIMTDKGFPLDDSKVTIFLNSRTKALRSIFMEFKITSFSRGDNNTYTMEGVCNVDRFYQRVFESYPNMTSFQCLKEFSKRSKLGFNSNVSESNDRMTWINPSMKGIDFVRDVIKSSYRSDESFISCYIDFYYNMNYIDVEEALKIDITDQVGITDTGMEVLSESSDSQNGKIGKLAITNDPGFDQTNNYFNKWTIINKSTGVSIDNAYLNRAKFYDINDKNYLIFDIDSITSEGDKTIILKSAPQDEEWFNNNIRTTYVGKLDADNMHENYNYANIQNQQNVKDLEKVGIVVTLNKPNYNFYRFQKIEVLISGASSTITTSQINQRLSGDWLITDMEFIFKDGQMSQKMTLIKRELELSQEELDSEPEQEKNTSTESSNNTNPDVEEEEIVTDDEIEVDEEDDEVIQFSYDLEFENSAEINDFFDQYHKEGFRGWLNKEFGNDPLFTSNPELVVGDDLKSITGETTIGGENRTSSSGEFIKDPINRERWNKIWDSSELIYNRESFNIVEFLCLNTAILSLAGTEFKPIIDNRNIVDIFESNNILSVNKTAYDNFNNEAYIETNANKQFADILSNTTNTDWQTSQYPVGFSGTSSQDIERQTSKDNNDFVTNADFYKFRQRGLLKFRGRRDYEKIVKFVKSYTGTNQTILDYKQEWISETNNNKILNTTTDKDWDILINNTDLIIPIVGMSNTMFELNQVHIIPTEGRNEDKIFKAISNVGKLIQGSLENPENDFADKFVKRVKSQIEFLNNKELVKSSSESKKNPVAQKGIPADISNLESGGKFDAWKRGKQIGKEETVIFRDVLVSRKIAPYLVSLFDAAKEEGIQLYINSGFRTNEDQIINGKLKSGQYRLYDKYIHGSKNKHYTYPQHKPTDPPLSSTGNLAARPGTSNHQSGIAVDLSPTRSNTDGYRWMVKNAWKYGFVRTVRRERWHWEYRPGDRMFDFVPNDNQTWDGLQYEFNFA